MRLDPDGQPCGVADQLLFEPLLPKPGPKKAKGRPRVPDRQALRGILFVLHTGIQWEYLQPGARLRLGEDALAASCGLERGRRLGPAPPAAERAAVEEPAGLRTGGDRLLARAGCPAGPESGPSPVDRARPGSKQHFIVDGQGIPLAVSLTGGNRNDVTQLEPLLDKTPTAASNAFVRTTN
ncbi:transposase [Streptomyces tendae]